MIITTLSSREFNQGASEAKRAAKKAGQCSSLIEADLPTFS